jgi:HSP20 family molecular chaperone IbpA
MSTRHFKRTWSLARYMDVDEENSKFEDGVLKIELKRNLPEELKPKKIKIN